MTWLFLNQALTLVGYGLWAVATALVMLTVALVVSPFHKWRKWRCRARKLEKARATANRRCQHTHRHLSEALAEGDRLRARLAKLETMR